MASVYEIKRIEDRIEGNSYVGRGIVGGMSKDGKNAVTAYFIMGRSENSRNRVFEEVEDSVYTKAFDESKVADPSLIIYRAIAVYREGAGSGERLIVTNGDQTDTIFTGYENGLTFAASLKSRQFEPDAPNLTPRISLSINLPGKPAKKCCTSETKPAFTYEMSILKSADSEGTACNRYTFDYEALPGVGHFIHTYVGDGNPLPTFRGEPERVEIPNDIDEFADGLWEALNEDNKISLYVRYVNLETGKARNRLINKNIR